jgi:hypothetical protein
MLFAVSLWVYIFVMVIVWGFFLVAKVHFYKFREYSSYITWVTKFISLALVCLSVLWLYFVYKFSGWPQQSTSTVEQAKTMDVY